MPGTITCAGDHLLALCRELSHLRGEPVAVQTLDGLTDFDNTDEIIAASLGFGSRKLDEHARTDQRFLLGDQQMLFEGLSISTVNEPAVLKAWCLEADIPALKRPRHALATGELGRRQRQLTLQFEQRPISVAPPGAYNKARHLSSDRELQLRIARLADAARCRQHQVAVGTNQTRRTNATTRSAQLQPVADRLFRSKRLTACPKQRRQQHCLEFADHAGNKSKERATTNTNDFGWQPEMSVWLAPPNDSSKARQVTAHADTVCGQSVPYFADEPL